MERPLPLLLYVHGGGYVIGDLETHDKVCRTLCHDVAAVVVAVDYRLAPEHPFPAAVDDVACALRWVGRARGRTRRRRVAHRTGRRQRRRATRRGRGAALRGWRRQRRAQALGLIYPVAQHYSEPSASMLENGEGKFLTTGVMKWFIDSYLGGSSDLQRHPEVALLHAPGLAALPPTWVGTMGHDPLRDEGHLLAQRIAAAGVATEHRHYPGAIHACIHFTAVSPLGGQVMSDLARWLTQRL